MDESSLGFAPEPKLGLPTDNEVISSFIGTIFPVLFFSDAMVRDSGTRT